MNPRSTFFKSGFAFGGSLCVRSGLTLGPHCILFGSVLADPNLTPTADLGSPLCPLSVRLYLISAVA